MLLFVILGLAVSSLVIGALGRFFVPGPDPMTLPETLAIGLAASAISGLLVLAVSGPSYAPLPLTVLIAAGLVFALRRFRTGSV